eukprot:m.141233 g.141233  ORF g.141233 m.141233 type:complete len:219 (-) comp22851_c0_seq2:298-954(-)
MQMMWIRLSMVLAAVGAVQAVAEGNGAAFPRPARQICCFGYTVHCLSCAASMTPTAYCAQEPRPPVCQGWVPPPTAPPPMAAPTIHTMSPTLPPVDSPTQLPTAVPTSSAPTAVPTSSAPTVFPTMTPPPSQTPTTAAPTVVTPQSSSGTGTSSSSDHTILYVIVAVLLVVAVFAIMALVKVSKDKQHASAAAQVNPSFAVNYEDGGQDYLDVTASSE